MKRYMRAIDADMKFGKNDLFQLPNLHAELVKALKSNSSQLSKFLEHHYFSKSKTRDGEFRHFYKGYKGTITERLKLFYLYIVVGRNWNLLRSVFRMEKIPWPENMEPSSKFASLTQKELFFLKYAPVAQFETAEKKYSLNLKNWAKASACNKSLAIPDHLYEKFVRAYESSQLKDPEAEPWQKKAKEEWEDYFFPEFVQGNYNPEGILRNQNIPARRGIIEMNNARFTPYQQAFARSRSNWARYRRNQYHYRVEGYEMRTDSSSLIGRFGIKNYAQFVVRIMNNAWEFFSEECKQYHYTQPSKQGPWKFGLGGRGNGYHRLGAAFVIAGWEDKKKLAQLRIDFPDLECIYPFKTTEDAKKFLTRWEGNFIVPEDEVVKQGSVDHDETLEDVFESPLGKQIEYKSLKNSLDFLNRDKNPERANKLWNTVVKGNHRLQHKYFPRHECDFAASYILKWLHRPRV